MRRCLFLLPFIFATAVAQEYAPTRHPAVFHSQANWVRHLTADKPTKIVIDPRHPDSPLFIYEDPDPQSPNHGIRLCWVRLPKSSTTLAVTDVLRSGVSSAIYESIKTNSDLVVMNGGFFAFGSKNDFVPVGLVISSGKRTSEFKNWSLGGFVLQLRGTPTVVPLGQFGNLSGIEHAIQSKPMLVENSKIAIKSDPNPPFNRSAVAVDRNGDIIVAGAFAENGDAVTLTEFSQFLAVPRSNGGPEAVYALNLDGGPDAHLYFPRPELHLGYSGQNYIPNAIHFSTK
jgi:hypothetical protein